MELKKIIITVILLVISSSFFQALPDDNPGSVAEVYKNIFNNASSSNLGAMNRKIDIQKNLEKLDAPGKLDFVQFTQIQFEVICMISIDRKNFNNVRADDINNLIQKICQLPSPSPKTEANYTENLKKLYLDSLADVIKKSDVTSSNGSRSTSEWGLYLLILLMLLSVATLLILFYPFCKARKNGIKSVFNPFSIMNQKLDTMGQKIEQINAIDIKSELNEIKKFLITNNTDQKTLGETYKTIINNVGELITSSIKTTLNSFIPLFKSGISDADKKYLDSISSNISSIEKRIHQTHIQGKGSVFEYSSSPSGIITAQEMLDTVKVIMEDKYANLLQTIWNQMNSISQSIGGINSELQSGPGRFLATIEKDDKKFQILENKIDSIIKKAFPEIQTFYTDFLSTIQSSISLIFSTVNEVKADVFTRHDKEQVGIETDYTELRNMVDQIRLILNDNLPRIEKLYNDLLNPILQIFSAIQIDVLTMKSDIINKMGNPQVQFEKIEKKLNEFNQNIQTLVENNLKPISESFPEHLKIIETNTGEIKLKMSENIADIIKKIENIKKEVLEQLDEYKKESEARKFDNFSAIQASLNNNLPAIRQSLQVLTETSMGKMFEDFKVINKLAISLSENTNQIAATIADGNFIHRAVFEEYYELIEKINVTSEELKYFSLENRYYREKIYTMKIYAFSFRGQNYGLLFHHHQNNYYLNDSFKKYFTEKTIGRDLPALISGDFKPIDEQSGIYFPDKGILYTILRGETTMYQ